METFLKKLQVIHKIRDFDKATCVEINQKNITVILFFN